MDTLVSGVVFGAALTTAGVSQPSVILGQLKFENWHMIQSFLTATATSTVVGSVANVLGHPQLQPRALTSIGLFAPYDGNVIGGLLLGAGMALSGACPGTVFSQTALGVRSGFYALAGGAAAGIVWTGILQPLVARLRAAASSSRPAVAGKEEARPTVSDVLGISRGTAAVATEALFMAIVTSTALLTKPGPGARIAPVHPIVGGLLIGMAQLVSVVLRKQMVGISGSYSEFGRWFWKAMGVGKESSLACTNMLFSFGIVGGSLIAASFFPGLVLAARLGGATPASPLMAGLGGFLMVMGASIAGGCTSGHGISGISLLSVSSLVTIGSAFAFGGLVSILV